MTLLLASVSHGALSVYLQVEGIDGESQSNNYQEWIDITGISRVGSNNVNIGSIGSGGGAGKYTPYGVGVAMRLPAGYDKLANFITKGQRTQISIHIVQAGGQEENRVVLQSYIFHDCLMEDLSLKAGSNFEPEVTFRFFYSRMEWEVTSLSNTGQPVASGSLDYNHLQNTISYQLPSTGGGGDPPSTDRDNDGLPNTWETAYGLNPDSSADRNIDSDGDGFSNYLEYLAGTLPNSYTSHLKIISLTQADGAVKASLQWASVQGKKYQVQIAVGGLDSSDWTTLSTVTAVAGASTSYELDSVPGNQIFYRVVLQP